MFRQTTFAVIQLFLYNLVYLCPGKEVSIGGYYYDGFEQAEDETRVYEFHG